MGLLLFLDFLPLFAVDGISAADEMVGTNDSCNFVQPKVTSPKTFGGVKLEVHF